EQREAADGEVQASLDLDHHERHSAARDARRHQHPVERVEHPCLGLAQHRHAAPLELVLARNQIIQFGATAKDPAFAKAAQRLNLLTTELQEGVMKTRMQPIEN